MSSLCEWIKCRSHSTLCYDQCNLSLKKKNRTTNMDEGERGASNDAQSAFVDTRSHTELTEKLKLDEVAFSL